MLLSVRSRKPSHMCVVLKPWLDCLFPASASAYEGLVIFLECAAWADSRAAHACAPRLPRHLCHSFTTQLHTRCTRAVTRYDFVHQNNPMHTACSAAAEDSKSGFGDSDDEEYNTEVARKAVRRQRMALSDRWIPYKQVLGDCCIPCKQGRWPTDGGPTVYARPLLSAQAGHVLQTLPACMAPAQACVHACVRSMWVAFLKMLA